VNKRIGCPGIALQFTDYSTGSPSGWNWDFPGGNPATSTQQNPLVVYNVPGTYPVTLTVTNAIGNDATTYTDYITITASSQSNPTTTNAERCGPGTVNLTASGSGLGVLRWWDAPGGGNLVATGSSYSPFINGTTFYYVDEEFPAGSTDYTGAFDINMGAGAFFVANDIRGIYFDVLSPVILNSVDVFANSAGDRTIEILDTQGNTVIDTTIFMTASGTNAQTINLNFALYPGTNYFIKCRGNVDLYRNSSGAVYPYTSSSVNITGSNANAPGYYYFFYNWIYSDITCNTGRTSSAGVDTCAVGLNELVDANNILITPNPSNGVFEVQFNPTTPGTYTLQVMNATGQIVYTEELKDVKSNFFKKIDLSNLASGNYMLNLSGNNVQLKKKLLIDKQ
jgi:PKD repeat protein